MRSWAYDLYGVSSGRLVQSTEKARVESESSLVYQSIIPTLIILISPSFLIFLPLTNRHPITLPPPSLLHRLGEHHQPFLTVSHFFFPLPRFSSLPVERRRRRRPMRRRRRRYGGFPIRQRRHAPLPPIPPSIPLLILLIAVIPSPSHRRHRSEKGRRSSRRRTPSTSITTARSNTRIPALTPSVASAWPGRDGEGG
jgi:hypothetical protein